MKTPYSASELLAVARNGNGQDVLDAVEAMNATHGSGITVLMLRCASDAFVADRFIALAYWDEPRPAMHWIPNNEVRNFP